MSLVRNAPAKPLPGDYALKKHEARLERKAEEQATMQEALRLDGKKCRVPRCAFRSLKVDPCHLRERHRGMGGDRSGERTTLETIIALCRRHHHLYDHFGMDIEPQEPLRGFRGPCAFYLEGQHVGTEKRLGVSVTREPR